MARINLYVPDADRTAIRRLAAILKKKRISMSEWFVHAVLERLAKERSDAK